MLRIVVSIGLFILLLWLFRENFTRITHLLKSVNIFIFGGAFLVFISGILFMAVRLKVALRPQELFVSIRELFPLTLIGYFFANFMPTSIGGDVVKGYYISKKNKKRLSTYTSVLMDRIIGMFSAVLIASLGLAMIGKEIEHRFIIWAIALLLMGCAIVAVSLFWKKFLSKISKLAGITRLLQALKLEPPVKKVYQTLRIYARHKRLILKMLALSMLTQFLCFSSVFLLAKSLGASVPFAKVMLAMPLIFVLSMLPVTINGLGLREWSFVLFFSQNIGEAAALSLSLLYLAVFLLISLIGGVIYLFWR